MRKPSLTARQLVTLVVLLSGTLVIMGLAWYTTKRVPHNNWLFTGRYACSFCDINSRINDVMTVKHGGVLYSADDHHQYFTYPTAALFLFWPLSWVSHFWAVTGWSFISIVSYAGLLMLGWHRVRGPLTLRSAGVSFWKSPNIFISVMLDGARSAEPPIRPGSTGASAFRHVWLWMRDATALSAGV